MENDKISLRVKCLELAFQCAQYSGKIDESDLIKMAKPWKIISQTLL